MSRIPSLCALLVLFACRPSAGREATVEAHVPVSLAVVRRDTMTSEVQLIGRLVPSPGGEAQLTAPADAVVHRVLVQVGDRVGQGTLLVQLDAPELETRAAELRAAADVAQQDAARQADLFAQGITSRKQLEERQANARAAESAAHAAETLLRRASITSPIRGAVQRVLVQSGERATAGAPLVEVVDASRLDLVAQVPAGPLALLRVGEVARVTTQGGAATAGTVVAIAPSVDSLTNAASVVVRIPNANLALRPGTGATASVVTGIQDDVLVVPDPALVLVGDSMNVFVVGADSIAHARPVSPGLRQGNRVVVTGELEPGDQVVAGNAFGLSDGMRVTVPVADTK
jgi:RND family efflux transporter MFP subunit